MNSPLQDFLQVATGSSEAGLLFPSRSSLQELKQLGFSEAKSPADISGKSYAHVTVENLKYWYDIASQYPAGHVSWTDSESHEQRATSLDPAENCFVLVADKKVVEHEPDLRRVTGPALSLA